MDPRDDYEAKRTALKIEINDEPFFGPFIVRNGRKGKVSDHYQHTGYSLSIATAARKVDAWILESAGWSRHRDYVVPRGQVGFSFDYFQGDLIRLVNLVDHIVALRKKPIDVQQLVLDLEPIFGKVWGAPLKVNALKCLAPEYNITGLATAPAKAQQKSIVMRVVWIYPNSRKQRSISNYLPVGTLKFPIEPDDRLGKGHFDRPYFRNGLFWRLGECITAEHRTDAWHMLSDAGRSEILTLRQSKLEGGHERTKRHTRKLQFITEHPELWNSPRELAILLREKGFFSQKTNLSNLIHQVEWHILRIKSDAMK